MKFVPETPEEELLARLATACHEYVIGFLELVKASVLGGEDDFRRLVAEVQALAQQRLDRALAQMEAGEE